MIDILIANIDIDYFDYILYDGLNSDNIAEISENLGKNYKRIIDDLQVPVLPKVTVKIWNDYNNFLNNMETDIGIRYTGATGYITIPKHMWLLFMSLHIWFRCM